MKLHKISWKIVCDMPHVFNELDHVDFASLEEFEKVSQIAGIDLAIKMLYNESELENEHKEDVKEEMKDQDNTLSDYFKQAKDKFYEDGLWGKAKVVKKKANTSGSKAEVSKQNEEKTTPNVDMAEESKEGFNLYKDIPIPGSLDTKYARDSKSSHKKDKSKVFFL